MARRKPTNTEVFINILFWIGMTMSVVGLFIYAAYQIYRKTQNKSFHYFKWNTTKSKAVDGESEEVSAEKSNQNSNVGTHPTINDFVDMDIKPDVEAYLKKLENYTGNLDKTPKLIIDYTPSLSRLMSKTDQKAYESVLVKQRNDILYHLQNITSDDLQIVTSPDVKVSSRLQIKNPPQALLDYYNNLPKHDLDARTSDEFCELLLKLAYKKYEDGSLSFMIDLEPKELANHSLYQSLDTFMQALQNSKNFKSEAINVLFQLLQKYIDQNYDGASLMCLIDKKGNVMGYGIPAGKVHIYEEDNLDIFLEAYRNKHPQNVNDLKEENSIISHSADPTFTAKGAKRLSRALNASEKKAVEEVESENDPIAHSAP